MDIAWRSEDGTVIAMSNGVDISISETEYPIDGKKFEIWIDVAMFGNYETESQAHYCLDQIWKDIKAKGVICFNLADDIYKS